MSNNFEGEVTRLNSILKERDYPFEIKAMEVVKNGVTTNGVQVSSPGYNAAAVIYPGEDFWKRDSESIIECLLDVYSNNMHNFDIQQFYDQDYVLEHVYPRLVSAEHEDAISSAGYVYRRWLDMLIELHVDVTGLVGNAVYLLRHQHLENLGLSFMDVYNRAIKNIRRTAKIQRLWDILHLNDEHPDTNDSCDLYVLTNEQCFYGAAAMACQDILDELSNYVGDEYIIFPSSIHEVIAAGLGMVTDLSYALDMVKEINETEVAREDKLTDSVYIYSHGDVSLYKA